MKNLRLHWTDSDGWVVDTPSPLTVEQVRRLVAVSVPRQVDRWRSLPHGDRRTALGLAVDLLKRGAIKQNVVPRGGETVLMESKR